MWKGISPLGSGYGIALGAQQRLRIQDVGYEYGMKGFHMPFEGVCIQEEGDVLPMTPFCQGIVVGISPFDHW